MKYRSSHDGITVNWPAVTTTAAAAMFGFAFGAAVGAGIVTAGVQDGLETTDPVIHSQPLPEPRIEYVDVPGPVITEYVEVEKPVLEVVTEYVTEYVEVPVETVVTEYVTTTEYLGLPPCLTDEVTATDCYWDAASRGNGIGTSFISFGGVAYYPETTE